MAARNTKLKQCSHCKGFFPAMQFRHGTKGVMSDRCQTCEAIPRLKINIDRNLAAQFLGVKHGTEPYGYYTFDIDNERKHQAKWSARA